MFKLNNRKNKRTALLVLAALTCAGAVGAGVLSFQKTAAFAMGNSGTQQEKNWSGGTAFMERTAEGMVLAAENERFCLYYHPETLAVQVKEKATGIVHSSIAEEGEKVEGMNDNWRGMMQSGITLELLDEKGNTRTWPLSTKKAEVKVQDKPDGFCAQVVWPEGIGVTVEVSLTESGIRVAVPEDGTWEEEECRYTLQSIYLFPFLDANRGQTQNGYLFVPDGCGALIRTSEKTISSEKYEKQIYGNDMGLGNFSSKSEQGMLLDAESIYVPVYGLIQNVGESGVAAIIEDGDEYASIVAYASGITTDFNFITAKFLVRQTYQMKISQKGASISSIQKERNHFDIAVSYHFLSGEDADYIGIAECYREYLLENGLLVKKAEAASDIPLKLEFLVSEQKDALLGTSTVVMTSAAQVDEILTDLRKEGITNLEVVLRGVSKEGATGVAPTVFDFERKAGTRKEWKALIEKYEALGISIAFYADFTRGYDGAGGYSNGDCAQSINKVLLKTFDNGQFTYLSPKFTATALDKYCASVRTLGSRSVAVDSLGKSLYSNWNKKSAVTRAEAKEILEGIDAGEMNLALYTPNAYLFSLASAAYDMPTNSSGYYIFTDTVPFLQVVLKGYLPMYATGFNFHANTDTDMLRCMEYGVYPSYYLTWEETIDLLDTASSWLYTSEYVLWKDSILSDYAQMNEVLRETEGAVITDRVVLADGVILMKYSNGAEFIVNYNDTDYRTGTMAVEANGCRLIKNGV